MRPVDIEADVHEMERRKRVEAIMNSKVRLDGVKSRRLITMFLPVVPRGAGASGG